MRPKQVGTALAIMGLLLMAAVPFGDLVPFTYAGYVPAFLIWMGTIMLIVARLSSPSNTESKPSYAWFIPLWLFVYGIITTTLLSGYWQSVFFGIHKQWLGALSLFCCIAAGLVARRYITIELLQKYYLYISGLALVSIVVSIPQVLAGERLGGVVSQPDIIAILLGTGLVVGLSLRITQLTPRVFYASQIVLVVAILLTRTRAVILLLPIWVVLQLVKYLQHNKTSGHISKAALLTGLVLVLFAAWYAAPRVLSVNRTSYGLSYRYDLTTYSSNYLADMPPWGYGPGGLGDVFGRRFELPSSLEHSLLIDQKVPQDSHNIVLDRFIEYGWLTGLSYLAVLIVFVIAAFRTRRQEIARTLSVLGVFLLVQQVITSTVVSLELLTWVCLLAVIMTEFSGEQNA